MLITLSGNTHNCHTRHQARVVGTFENWTDTKFKVNGLKQTHSETKLEVKVF